MHRFRREDGRGAGELGPVWQELCQALDDHPAVVFHGRLSGTDRTPCAVWEGNWREFIALAQRLDAPVLYAETEVFHAGELDELEFAGEPSAGLGGHDGKIASITVTFHAGGVLHLWEATASWRVELDGRLEQWHESRYQDRHSEQERRRLERDQQADRLARTLVGVPEFRQARSQEARKDVALRLNEELRALHQAAAQPGSQPGDRFVVWDVVRKATYLLEDEIAPTVWQDLEQRYPELAEEFTVTADFQQVTTARHRKEVAKRFLTNKAAGLVPKGYQIDQFLSHVKSLPDQRRLAQGSL